MQRIICSLLLAASICAGTAVPAGAESLSVRIATEVLQRGTVPPTPILITTIERLGDDGMTAAQVDFMVKLAYAEEARKFAHELNRVVAAMSYRSDDNVVWYLSWRDQAHIERLRTRILDALERSGYEAHTLGISLSRLYIHGGVRVDG